MRDRMSIDFIGTPMKKKTPKFFIELGFRTLPDATG